MKERIKVPLGDIKVIDRQRQEYGDIATLAQSMATFGLIQPIVVNQDLRLIAGGRRLRAATHLQWPSIDVVFRETLTEDELQELELEENIRRKDVTWQERVLAIATIQTLKKRTDPNWGFKQTGELVGLSSTHAFYCIHVARALRAGDKQIGEASGLTDAIRILLQRKEDEAMVELSRRVSSVPVAVPAFVSTDPLGLTVDVPVNEGLSYHQRMVAETSNLVPVSTIIHRQECLSWLAEFEEPCIDAIITDPPYAIDMENLDQSNTGLIDIDRVEDTHVVADNLTLLERFIPLAYTALKPSGFLAMWCDPTRWMWLHDLCAQAGFAVQRWPVVWIKTHPCINQAAQYNFTKSVEFVCIARKKSSVLARVAPVCHIAASGIRKEDSHPFAKPPEVWDFLLKHICMGNSLVVDPFLGSGSIIHSVLNAGHRFIGCEIDEIHHAYAVEKYKAWHLAKNPKVLFS